jgi:predicted small lipoprotein YifL
MAAAIRAAGIIGKSFPGNEGRRKSDMIGGLTMRRFAVGEAKSHLGAFMSNVFRSLIALSLALSLAACAAAPPPPPEVAPPPQKKLDAKTQLETGKTY